jgi:hypothetical protein
MLTREALVIWGHVMPASVVLEVQLKLYGGAPVSEAELEAVAAAGGGLTGALNRELARRLVRLALASGDVLRVPGAGEPARWCLTERGAAAVDAARASARESAARRGNGNPGAWARLYGKRG